MAESTRSKHQHLETLQTQVNQHHAKFITIKADIGELKTDVQEMKDMLRTLVNQQHHPPPPPPFNLEANLEMENHDPRRFNNRGVKLDFPHFQGINPAAWLFKANHYFDFHQTSLL